MQVTDLLQIKNHLEICKRLKTMPLPNTFDQNHIRVFDTLIRSNILAVEKTALNTIIRFGKNAEPFLPGLIHQFNERLHDAGCDFSCCGFQAFHGPIALYLEALLALADRDELSQEVLARMEYPDLVQEMVTCLDS